MHWGEPATLEVGNFCSFAKNVTILLGGNHRIDWITTYPFPALWECARHVEGHPVSRGDVVIGHDVWVGTGAMILSGVRIGSGAVVGAGAVVTRDVPPYTVVAGNPAREIRRRFDDDEVEILLALEWWHWDDGKIRAAMSLLLSGDVHGLQRFSESHDTEIS